MTIENTIAFGKRHQLLRAYSRNSPINSRFGLSIAHQIQTFRWEADIQKRIANEIADHNKIILNIGLGPGYAHLGFESACTRVVTLEVNPLVIRNYLRRFPETASCAIVCGEWAQHLSKLEVTSFDAAYFDATTVDNNFKYRPSDYLSEFRSFSQKIRRLGFRGNIYYLAFQPKPLSMGRGWARCLQLVRSYKIPVIVHGFPPLFAMLYLSAS